MDINDIDALKRRIAELEATQRAQAQGSGAIAQNGGEALGERAAKVAGDFSGTLITGTQIVNNYLDAGGKVRGKEDIAKQVAGYLRWLRARTESVELRGIERASGAPVVLLPLETAYVTLRAKTLSRLGGGYWNEGNIELNLALSLGRRLAIVGGPGCGKTTALLHMA